MLPFPPPARLNCFDAKRYARAVEIGGYGMSIRRVDWNDTTGTPLTGFLPLAWISWRDGLFFIRKAAEDRVLRLAGVVEGDIAVDADISSADLMAKDWTTEPPTPTSTGWENPNDGIGDPPPVSGGGGSGDSGGTTGGGSGGGSGSGSGSGSGVVPSRMPRPRPPLLPVGVTLAIARVSGDACLSSSDPITDSFFAHVTLAASATGLWFLTLSHGSPSGPVVAYHGTVVPGVTLDAAFSILAAPALIFGVQARLWKPGTSRTARGDSFALMRPLCPVDPPGCPSVAMPTKPDYISGATGGTPTTLNAAATTSGGHSIASWSWKDAVTDEILSTSDSLTITPEPGWTYRMIEVRATSDCGSYYSWTFYLLGI